MACSCCRIEDLRCKEVICIKDGACLGSVNDVEVNTCSGKLESIVIFGRNRWLGIFGREEDIVIPWEHIDVIGEDTVLVSCDCHRFARGHKQGFFTMLFGGKR